MACQVAVVCQVTHLLTGFLLWTWQVFRFTLLVAFASRDFVPKMKIREGHLYLQSSLCEGSPGQSNLNV